MHFFPVLHVQVMSSKAVKWFVWPVGFCCVCCSSWWNIYKFTWWWYWCHVISRWDCHFCLTVMLNESVQQISSLCTMSTAFFFRCRQRVVNIGYVWGNTSTNQKCFSWIDITAQPKTVINKWRKCTWNAWLCLTPSVSTIQTSDLCVYYKWELNGCNPI